MSRLALGQASYQVVMVAHNRETGAAKKGIQDYEVRFHSLMRINWEM